MKYNDFLPSRGARMGGMNSEHSANREENAAQVSAQAVPLISGGLSVIVLAAFVAFISFAGDWPIQVIDGDTVRQGLWTYRLVGFDAPETRAGRYRCQAERDRGLEAKRRLIELVASAKSVRVLRTSWALDRYGRLLGRIEIDGRDLMQIGMAEGWAKPYSGRGIKPDWCG